MASVATLLCYVAAVSKVQLLYAVGSCKVECQMQSLGLVSVCMMQLARDGWHQQWQHADPSLSGLASHTCLRVKTPSSSAEVCQCPWSQSPQIYAMWACCCATSMRGRWAGTNLCAYLRSACVESKNHEGNRTKNRRQKTPS
jgi:hypothetical protein